MSAQRIDATLGVDHVLVAVGAHDVHDRVGLADVGEKAVAEPLAFVRAGDEAGDVVEVDRVPHDLRRAHGLRDLDEALVEHGHHRHVRLDRREGIVGGLDAGLRERVEQRGLAGVRQPDDADARAHAGTPRSSGVPRAASELRAIDAPARSQRRAPRAHAAMPGRAAPPPARRRDSAHPDTAARARAPSQARTAAAPGGRRGCRQAPPAKEVEEWALGKL